jgi:hypothetical protein
LCGEKCPALGERWYAMSGVYIHVVVAELKLPPWVPSNSYAFTVWRHSLTVFDIK